MIRIEEIRAFCRDESIKATQHFTDRIFKRGIEYGDIICAIMNGEIIEHYPDDYPYPSVLISGHGAERGSLHVVAGMGDGEIYLITAYRPSPEKWESDCKKRKAVE